MSNSIPGQLRPADTRPFGSTCPSWCVAPHGLHAGEEDWVHVSEPMPLTERILARICLTVEPDGARSEGPIVLVGSVELTPEQTNDIGLALQALARVAAETTPAHGAA